jgi:hypothetical protein
VRRYRAALLPLPRLWFDLLAATLLVFVLLVSTDQPGWLYTIYLGLVGATAWVGTWVIVDDVRAARRRFRTPCAYCGSVITYRRGDHRPLLEHLRDQHGNSAALAFLRDHAAWHPLSRSVAQLAPRQWTEDDL